VFLATGNWLIHSGISKTSILACFSGHAEGFPVAHKLTFHLIALQFPEASKVPAVTVHIRFSE
jgi:hypothetical protein